MHHLVHDKRCPRHVAGVFHQRNAEEQDEYVREKDNHAAYAANDAVDQQVAQHAVGQGVLQPVAQGSNARFNPVHRVGAERESELEHGPHKE